MNFIQDITHLNPDMADVNDVRLSSYPHDADNAKLTKFYIWSNHAIGAAKPSVDLLQAVRNAFLSKTEPNRFVFRATYGHGKTHLALALANFFGRPSGAKEVSNILAQLRSSSPNRAESFEVFKADRAPYLIVRLFGETIRNLPQAVVSAIETALSEHEETKDAKLDFWFDKALAIFQKFSVEEVGRAEEFLKESNTDFPTLCANLNLRDGSLYELACHLIEHIRDVPPNFGREVDLEKLIYHVCNEYCGAGKPFSGVLFLFDEFSAFVRTYARDFALTQGTPLQSLLDGIKENRGSAVFVALAQYDPDSDVQTVFRRIGAGEDDRQGVIKELTRLPDKERFTLYSSLEIVLSNFLLQDEENWPALIEPDEVHRQIEDAADEVMRLFPEHYNESMGWRDDDVQQVMAKGCFPFHPLTIAILCKSNLRGDESGARTVMGYVDEALKEKQGQLALFDGRLNWISPISLIEKFGQSIVEEEDLWRQYLQAKRSAGEEAPDAQKSVLNAMLLHEVVRLKVGRSSGDFERNIAVLCGLSKSMCKAALEELYSAKYIRRDDSRGVYTFFPIGEESSKVDEPLRIESAAVLGDPVKLQAALEKAIETAGRQELEIRDAPGNPQDWAAAIRLMPRALFSAQRIKSLVETYQLSSSYILNEPNRGFVFSLIASTNEDLAWFKTHAESILDEALAGFKATPPPVVLQLPQFVQGSFVRALVDEQVLKRWSAEQKKQLGIKPFEDVMTSVRKEIETNRVGFQTESYIVPSHYRGAVQQLTVGSQVPSLDNVLRICYSQAYRFAPPFFAERASTAQLKTATYMACQHLLRGTFSGWDDLINANPKAHGKAKDLYNRFLQGTVGQIGWGVVDITGRLREPASSRIHEGWKVLDEAVPLGAQQVPVKAALLQLLNAPYGYDPNTLSLLFSAWCGFNSGLEIFNFKGTPVTLKECLGTKPDLKDFLQEVMGAKELRLTRHNAQEKKKHIELLIHRIRHKEPFKADEANAALNELELYAEDKGHDTRLIDSSLTAISQLKADITRADAYEKTVAGLILKINQASGLKSALDAFEESQSDIPLGCVQPDVTYDAAALIDLARTKLAQTAESFCSKFEKLTDIRNAGDSQRNLESAAKIFSERGLGDLKVRAQTALENLAEREAELSAESLDAEFVASLKPLRAEKELAALRVGLQSLGNYQPHSSKTVPEIEKTRIAVEEIITSLLTWFSELPKTLESLVSSNEFSRFDKDIERHLDRFENTPEGTVLQDMQKRIEALEKLWDKLSNLRREKPKNNIELKKLVKDFDKLAESEILSDAQKVYIVNAKTEVETRFVAAVESATAGLESYEVRNRAGEDALVLKTELDKALMREMAYLGDDQKARLRALDNALQKRIDEDEITRVEANFLRIKDSAKRRECIRRLEKIIGMGEKAVS